MEDLTGVGGNTATVYFVTSAWARIWFFTTVSPLRPDLRTIHCSWMFIPFRRIMKHPFGLGTAECFLVQFSAYVTLKILSL